MDSAESIQSISENHHSDEAPTATVLSDALEQYDIFMNHLLDEDSMRPWEETAYRKLFFAAFGVEVPEGLPKKQKSGNKHR